MQTSDKPSLIPVPFANSGTKNTIPTSASPTPGLASLDTGFPPVTMTPIVAGGIPPAGADFNGIFNLISAASRWAQAGAGYTYDTDFSTGIGGYPKGAVLLKDTLDGFWMSTTDNNTADPDAGGANWVDPLSGRLLNIQRFTANGTYTPTPGTKSIIVEAVGGGGGGAGAVATTSTTSSGGGSGGSGAYGKSRYTTDFSGVTVTVGAAGVSSAASNGSNGGTTSFGALLSCPGGRGGSIGGTVSASSTNISGAGGPNSTAPTGANLVSMPGSSGQPCIISQAGSFVGPGGSGPISSGGQGYASPGGGSAGVTGGGGSGGLNGISSGSTAGSSGGAGLVIVYEFA